MVTTGGGFVIDGAGGEAVVDDLNPTIGTVRVTGCGGGSVRERLDGDRLRHLRHRLTALASGGPSRPWRGGPLAVPPRIVDKPSTVPPTPVVQPAEDIANTLGCPGGLVDHAVTRTPARILPRHAQGRGGAQLRRARQARGREHLGVAALLHRRRGTHRVRPAGPFRQGVRRRPEHPARAVPAVGARRREPEPGTNPRCRAPRNGPRGTRPTATLRDAVRRQGRGTGAPSPRGRRSSR